MIEHDEKQTGSSDDAVVNKARALLEQSEDGLDETTLRCLKQARMNALDQAGSKPRYSKWLVPAGGFAATAATVAIVVGVNVFTANLAENEMPDAFNDIELLVSSDELEFYEQLEFYAWLDEQGKNG